MALWLSTLFAWGIAAYKAQAYKCDNLIEQLHAVIERKIINSISVSGFFTYVGR